MTRLLLALSIVFMTATAFAQQTLHAQAFRTVNVRTGPGTQYNIAGQLTGGETVEVTGRSDTDSNWLRIAFNRTEGWIAFFTVTLNGSPDSLPIVEPQIELAATSFDAGQDSIQPLRAETQVHVTAFRRVNVRSGPGTDFDRIGSLNPGDSVDIIGQSVDQEWLLIDYAGESGWVAYFVVSVTGDPNVVPIVETSEHSDMLIAESVNATSVTITTRFNTNLRLQPNFDADVIVVIPFNTTLDVQTRSVDSTWLRVIYEGAAGWLMTGLVNIDPGGLLQAVSVE